VRVLWKPVLRLWVVLAGFRLGSHLRAADVAPYSLYVVSDTLHAALCCVPILALMGEDAIPAAGRVVAGQSCRRASACIICAHVMNLTRPLTHMAVQLGVRLLGC
jgi:hypothetical protein